MPRVTIPGVGDVNFPDNMSRDEIMSRAQAMQSQATVPTLNAKDLPMSDLFSGAVSRGLEGMKGTAFDLIPALAGSMVGKKDYAKEQLKEYADRMAAEEAVNPTAYKSYKDIQGAGDIFPFLGETVGELLPDAASFIGGAGIGTQVGKQIAKRGTKELAETIAKRGLTDEAAAALEKRVVGSAVAKGADIGSKTGLFGSSMAMNVPDVFQSVYEATGSMEPGLALTIGPIVGMLDTYLPGKILSQLGPAGKARLAADLLGKSEVVPPKWRNAFIGNVLQTAGGEGLTEGAQEALTIAAEQIAGDKKGFFDPKNIDRIITSSLKGAVGGTTLGTPGAAVEAGREVGAAKAEIGRRKDIAAQQEEQRLATEQKAFEAQQQATGDLFGQEVPQGPGMPSRTVMERELANSPVLRQITDLQARKAAAQTPMEFQAVEEDIKRLADSLPAQSYEQQLVLNFAQNMLGYTPGVTAVPSTIDPNAITVDQQGVSRTPEQAQAERTTPQDVQGYQADLFPQELGLAQAQERVQGLPPTIDQALAGPAEAPAQFKTTLDADSLKGTGLKPQSGFFKQLLDKDMANPEDQQAVAKVLAQVRSNPSIADSTKKAVESVATQAFSALAGQTNMVGPRGGIRNEVNYGRVQPRPTPEADRGSLQVPEQQVSEPTQGVGTPEQRGLGATGVPAGQPGVREAVQSDTLTEQTVEPTPAIEAAKPPIQAAPAKKAKAQAPAKDTAKPVSKEDRAGLIANLRFLEDALEGTVDPTEIKSLHAEINQLKKQLDSSKYQVNEEAPFEEFKGDVTELTKQLRAALDKMGLHNVGVKLEQEIVREYKGKVSSHRGEYNPFKRLITLSLKKGPDFLNTLNHEAIHAMRDTGVFSSADWKILSNMAKSKWIAEYDIKKRWEDTSSSIDEDSIAEEAVAEAFRHFQVQTPKVQSIIEKAVNALRKIGNYIRGYGYQTEQEIFGKAASGQLAKDRAEIIARFDAYLDTQINTEPKYQIAAAKEVFTGMDKVIRDVPYLKDSQKAALSDGIKTAGGTMKSALLSLLPMHALGEVADSVFPGLGTKFNTLINERSGYENKLNNGIDAAVNRAKEAIKLHPEHRDAFNKIVNTSTVEEVDPTQPRSKYENDKDKLAAWDKLSKEYNKLNPVWKNLYITMRDGYKQMYEEIKTAINARIDETDLEPKAKILVKADIMKRLADKGMIEPYFALGREGTHWLASEYVDKAGQKQFTVEAFKSDYERKTRQEQLLKSGATRSDPYSSLDRIDYRRAPAGSFVNSVLQIMDVNKVPQEAIDEMMRLFLTTLPETAFAQSFQKRKGTAGYMEDTIGVFERKMRNTSHQVANMMYNPKLTGVVDAMEDQTRTAGETGQGNATQAEYVNEFKKHLKYVLSPTKNDVGSILTSAAFTYTLGFNLSSALVNMANVPMIVAPYLKGKYADAAVARALGDATKVFTGSGMKARLPIIGSDGKAADVKAMPSIANYDPNSEMGKKYATLIKIANERGQLNRSQLYELIQGDTRTGLMAKFNAMSGWMFHHGERMNREVTMLATYNLEMDRLKKQGITGVAAEEQAANAAIYTTELTNGGISAAAAPRVAQNPIGKMFFMYKRYGVSMYYMMFKTFKEATQGNTPEERKAAWKQLGGIVGMSALMAGAQGIPMYGALSMLYAMFCDDDDEDLDTVTRKHLGEFLYKGPVEYATNLAIAGRITLNDLILRDSKGGAGSTTFSQQVIQALGGPVFGVADRIQRGYSKLNEGHVQRAMEDLLPSAISNGFKAYRYATEGTTTLRGDPITGDVGVYNAMAQAIGFAPADYTRQLEINATEKGIDKTLSERSAKLKQKYYMAKRNGDTDGMANVKEKLLDMGEKHPELGINAASVKGILDRSMTAQERASKEMLHGVRYNKKRLAEVKASLAEYED